MGLPSVRTDVAHRRATSRFALPTVLVLAVSSAALAVTAHPVAASAAPRARPAAGEVARFAKPLTTLGLHGRGNGHGHGMSQYGAEGAALAGLSSRQIVAFYFPGTTATTLAPSAIRVSIGGAGTAPTVSATTGNMQVTGYGPLPRTGYLKFHLFAEGTGSLGLGGQRASGTWERLANALPGRADFSSGAGYVRLFFTDRTSTRYRGTVGAVRNGSGLLTINRVSLDGYTEGVVPREMPASWQPSAVAAQAIATRSYGRNAVENNVGSLYDICDSSWCQAYGGMDHYSSSGALLWSDDPAAIVGNQNVVLRYEGRTIFAQFSASNGGAELSGGQPYLPDKSDPYDNTASGDPYLNWSDSVSAAGVASYYGLRTVTSITVTARSGYGPWGGWVETASVIGTNQAGSATTIRTTGNTLAAAMGVQTAYFLFDA